MTDVLDIIRSRHCKRAFLKREVPREIVESVLAAAVNAPSSKNMQPWRVAVVSGETCIQLSETLCNLFDRNAFEEPDYQYSPDPLPPEWKARARECGFALYELKGIAKDDRIARREHERENYTFFGASTALFFFLPMNAERGNFLDLGLFMQNVMLGFLSLGVGSCPQASMKKFSKTIKAALDRRDEILVSGLSIGYVDEAAIVNTFVPPRLRLEDFVEWY